jgi:hypothetical protein
LVKVRGKVFLRVLKRVMEEIKGESLRGSETL